MWFYHLTAEIFAGNQRLKYSSTSPVWTPGPRTNYIYFKLFILLVVSLLQPNAVAQCLILLVFDHFKGKIFKVLNHKGEKPTLQTYVTDWNVAEHSQYFEKFAFSKLSWIFIYGSRNHSWICWYSTFNVAVLKAFPVCISDEESLTTSKLKEFRTIYLYYLDFCQKQQVISCAKNSWKKLGLPAYICNFWKFKPYIKVA